jgi:DNA-cytosine methyltransferase
MTAFKIENVLSLFDGMSCTQLALQRAGISYKKYFASEVDKFAIEVTQKNFPNTIQIGDVRNVKGKKLPKIDLLVGGSPCQGFSFAGKQLNFNDPRSKLFFEFVRLLKECKPTYFLLENVVMQQEYQDVISSYLGVQPILINSNLLSAQSRKRLYWTNIPTSQPTDKGILLKDIIHETRKETVGVPVPIFNVHPKGKGASGDVIGVHKGKSRTVTPNKGQGQYVSVPISKYIVPFNQTLKVLDREVKRGKIGYFNKDSQANRVYQIHGKSVTLCGSAGGRGARTGFYLFGCITPSRVERTQNGQRFNNGKKFYTLTTQDHHGIFIEGYIRKLTPIECERLQTVPDNYTASVSDSQRYKMLGNGFTVDVIAHILKGIKPKQGLGQLFSFKEILQAM